MQTPPTEDHVVIVFIMFFVFLIFFKTPFVHPLIFPFSLSLSLYVSYPCGGGEHVFLPQLETVHLLQDHSAVLLTLEEVDAAEDGGDALGLVPLHQHCSRRIVGFHTPGGEKSRRRWGGQWWTVCEWVRHRCCSELKDNKTLVKDYICLKLTLLDLDQHVDLENITCLFNSTKNWSGLNEKEQIWDKAFVIINYY